ncbi:MAG: SDR family NAD(P)-dependent oxidoreductase [Rubrivivax sp.]
MDTHHLTIITGASRGLGLAMLQQRLAEGHHVLAISRTPPHVAAAGVDRLQIWQADLSDAAPVAARLHDWLVAVDPATLASVSLINNAGAVSRLAPLARIDSDELVTVMRVGLEAPLLLSAAFLRGTQGLTVPRRLLMISSGLGRRPMASGAAYGATKAGLDHLVRALAIEQAELPDGARVMSLAPGVVDTDMQAQLRAADPKLFGEREHFVRLKEEGRLDSPAQAAAKVLRVLDSADFGVGDPVGDVRTR